MSKGMKKRMTKTILASLVGLSDWMLVCETLHPSGSAYGRLPVGADTGARCLLDGAGRFLPSNDERIQTWAHVADSTKPAIATTAGYIRQVLNISTATARAS